MIKRRGVNAIAAGALAACVSASAAHAHHSSAMFDTSTEITLEGVVTEYGFRNPHIFFTIETDGPDGAPMTQEIEAGASSVMLPLGLTPDSLAPGDHVTVVANPHRRGEGHLVLGRTLTKDDGTVLPLNITSASARHPGEAPVATSIAGTWFAPLSGFFGINGARRDWKLTEAAEQAAADYDSMKDSAHAQCIPVAAPLLMVYPVTTVVTVSDDEVVFDIDWMTSQRVVHLDMDSHPADLEPSLHGHSIGRWEGDTLVVDTVGYAEHREGLGFGLPSSEGKHLVERFSVSEDGRHLDYAVTVEDPAYLLEPASYASQWDHRPDLEPSGLACDLEIAQRYLSGE